MFPLPLNNAAKIQKAKINKIINKSGASVQVLPSLLTYINLAHFIIAFGSRMFVLKYHITHQRDKLALPFSLSLSTLLLNTEDGSLRIGS